MASRIAQVPALDLAATAIYISNAQEFHEENPILPPMVLIPGAQDPGLSVTTNSDLVEQINDPEKALLIVNPEEEISNGLFTRIPEINCEESIQIKQSLLDAGLIDDSNHRLLIDPKNDQSWKSALPVGANLYSEAIGDILLETYAGHSPSSDQNEEVFSFIEMHLP